MSTADRYSASPALRLRYRILAAKSSIRPRPTVLPPPVGEPRSAYADDLTTAAQARADKHPLAMLMRLRAEAAVEIERLLEFLDCTEGIVDDEYTDEDCNAQLDLEQDTGNDEPSLGWPEGTSQEPGRWGDAADLEAAARRDRRRSSCLFPQEARQRRADPGRGVDGRLTAMRAK